jgi:bisphosphoglycerate-independent phosphoglycerate mutase (AlkP superfamily)
VRRLAPITFSEAHCNLSFKSVHDGWGISPKKGTKGDAIDAADTTNMDTIAKDHAYRTLLAHGNAVGLSDGLMGNSEVGYVDLNSDSHIRVCLCSLTLLRYAHD